MLERVLPDAFGEALDEADQFFQAEMPAVQQFSFGPSEAARITQPILNVLGSESVQRFVEGAELVQSWFPHAERLTVADAGHLLMVQNPTPLAQGLHDFSRAIRSPTPDHPTCPPDSSKGRTRPADGDEECVPRGGAYAWGCGSGPWG